MKIDWPNGCLEKALFDDQLRPRFLVLFGIAAFSLAWIVALLAASLADGTLHLPAPGKGLLDHYGFQACVASAPLVLTTTYYALSYFLRLLRNLDELIKPDADAEIVQSIIRPHILSLFLHTKWRNMLWLFMVVGAAISIMIFKELTDPAKFWGNDVFNATIYRNGFIVANSFLFLLWSVIYPVGIFYALHITVSTETIVAQLKKRKILELNFLHIDKCGGMARFGTLNFIVMLIYLWPFGVAYALHLTHRFNYLSLVLGGLAISAAFIIQSVYGLYWVSRSINAEREEIVAALNDRIRTTMQERRRNFSAALATMEYRDKVLAVTSFPYSGFISAAVNTLRFAPTILSLANLFFRSQST